MRKLVSVRMREVLVTGGAGFIGSALVRRLLLEDRDWRCTVLDNLDYAGSRPRLPRSSRRGRFQFVRGDVRDRALMERLVQKSEVVVHAAAKSHVDRSYGGGIDFVSTNVLGTATVLEAARKHSVDRLVLLSTPEIHGPAGRSPMKEDHPLRPMSPYAGSKAAADRLAYSYHACYGLPLVTIKPSNNYGPSQYPEKLIPLFITNAIEGKPLPVYGGGQSVRDWIHVDDCCRAIEAILEADLSCLKGEEVFIASGRTANVLSLARLILRYLRRDESLIRHIQDRPAHVGRFVLSTRKLTRLTGFRPTVKLEEGIRRTVEWYAGHQSWWKKIKKSPDFTRFYRDWYGRLGLDRAASADRSPR